MYPHPMMTSVTYKTDAHPSPGLGLNPDARIPDGSVAEIAPRGDLL